MGGADEAEEDVFLDALDAMLRCGPVVVRTTWAETPPTMTAAAWRALSDPEAPLLGDGFPDLDVDDGSTRWAVYLDALAADYGHGRGAILSVPAFGSEAPTVLTLLDKGTTLHRSAAVDALDAMERADAEAEALGWKRRQALPAARP